MKVWLLKHKGANQWYNLETSHKVTIGKKEMHAQLCFLRRKDAQEYLKATHVDHPEFWEVVGATLPKSKHDNRFSL